jgi:hypothetical protein
MWICMICADKLKNDEACMGKIEMLRECLENLMQERDLLEHPGIDERIILKGILNEEDGWTYNGSSENVNEPSNSTKCRVFV